MSKKSQSAANTTDACSVSGIVPYKNRKEFLAELAQVLEQDYGVSLIGAPLEAAATNIDQFLMAFL